MSDPVLLPEDYHPSRSLAGVEWNNLSPVERRYLVKTFWIAGASAGETAMRIPGANRNKVIGIWTRLKLKREMTKAAKSAQVRAARPKKEPMPKPAPVVNQDRSVQEMVDYLPDPIDGHVPIGIMDLPSRPGVRCRFPVVGGYCGAPSDEKTYCEHHMAIAYRPVEKLRMPKDARF